MKKYINRQARDEKRAELREARASRKSQDLALKLGASKLAIHALERTLERLILSHKEIELAALSKLEGDQILKREAQRQGFYGSLVAQYGSMVMPYLQQLLALQAAQSGLELEDEDGLAAVFAAMAASAEEDSEAEDDIVDLDEAF